MSPTASALLLAAKNPLEIIGGITTFVFGLVAAVYLASKVIGWFSNDTSEGPTLIGTTVPELGEGLDLAKRYDVIYGGDYHSNFVEKLSNVRIVGYIGDNNEGSKMYLRGRWLAFESTDGMRSYVMPHAIVSLQECSPQSDS